MRNINLVMLLCLVTCSLYSQEVVSTSGGQVENSTAQLSWTLGEPIIETVSDGGHTLTQGLHQSNLLVTAIDEIQRPNFNISAFPNPATDYIELTVERETQDELSFQLFDPNGKLLLEERFANDKAIIQTVDLLPAMYFITIKEGQDNIQTFQIIKK
jgi:hypothetical protein